MKIYINEMAIIYGLSSVVFILLLGWFTCCVNPFVAAAVTYIFSATIFGLIFPPEENEEE